MDGRPNRGNKAALQEQPKRSVTVQLLALGKPGQRLANQTVN